MANSFSSDVVNRSHKSTEKPLAAVSFREVIFYYLKTSSDHFSFFAIFLLTVILYDILSDNVWDILFFIYYL